MRLRVIHRTWYRYLEQALRNSNELRLQPLHNDQQHREFSLIRVLPATRLQHYMDFYGNTVHHFEITGVHDSLSVVAESVVETKKIIDFDDFPYGFLHEDLTLCAELESCHDFLGNSAYVNITPEIWREAVDVMEGSDDVFETSYAIMEHINKTYEYVSGVTDVSTTSGQVQKHKKGVCQDFAHLMVAMLRALRIPARYVSGYLFDPSHNYMRGTHASHAWVEVYIHEKGWFGLDPTNNRVVDDYYIIVAVGRDYDDVAPVKGAFIGTGRRSLTVEVEVEQVD